MINRSLCAVVLAAGAGTRMRSERPKPLHLLAGRPMVIHVLDSLAELQVEWVVLVVGHGAERVVKTLNDAAPAHLPMHYVEQESQNGTGDAVSIALASLPERLGDEADDTDILILPGDTPLLEPATVEALVDQHHMTGAAATLLTVRAPDPSGYGRIVRNKRGAVKRIVEEADASEEEKEIDEVNTSVYCFRTALLGPALRRITTSNAQHEYYLTDVIEVLSEAGHQVDTLIASDSAQASGVNDRVQLAEAEVELRCRINEKWMRAGVTLVDPSSTYIDVAVQLSEDVSLLPNTRLQGNTRVGRSAEIGPDTELVDCWVGEGASVSKTTGHQANIGAGAKVGPFVVLRPGAEVAPGATIGPFFTAVPQDES